jgi:hypothetical protein
MSALGHKQTLGVIKWMSALPPKADMDQHDRDVRFVPKADSCTLAIVITAIAENREFSPAVGAG